MILKQIYYRNVGEVIPFLVRISHGKAVAAQDMGADDRVTWGPRSLTVLAEAIGTATTVWKGLRLRTARTAANME